MLYKFRDVNEELTQEYIPAEALQINGELIETQIEGYHTLYVQGREALSPEINTYEIGTKNGEIRKNKRYPAQNYHGRVPADCRKRRGVPGSL